MLCHFIFCNKLSQIKPDWILLFTNSKDQFEEERFPIQTPQGAWPGLGTQPRYKAPGDPRVKIVERQ